VVPLLAVEAHIHTSPSLRGTRRIKRADAHPTSWLKLAQTTKPHVFPGHMGLQDYTWESLQLSLILTPSHMSWHSILIFPSPSLVAWVISASSHIDEYTQRCSHVRCRPTILGHLSLVDAQVAKVPLAKSQWLREHPDMDPYPESSDPTIFEFSIPENTGKSSDAGSC
jgi:hypothetical protein